MLADTWGSLTKINLKNGWNKIWPETENETESTVKKEGDGILEEVTSLFEAISGFKRCETSDAEEWLSKDTNNPDFQTLTDEEITNTILESEAPEFDESDEEKKYVEKGLSHSEALKSFETGMLRLEK